MSETGMHRNGGSLSLYPNATFARARRRRKYRRLLRGSPEQTIDLQSRGLKEAKSER